MASGHVCESHGQTNGVCSQRHWFIELSIDHAVEQQWRLLFFSPTQMTLLLIFTFIFIYFYIKLWFQIQKCHYSTWRGYCFCVFAYMYICMYAGYAMYCMCLLGFFRDSCDSSDVSERETIVFLALFIWKEDLLPHFDSRKPTTAHTMLCCYLKIFFFFVIL